MGLPLGAEYEFLENQLCEDAQENSTETIIPQGFCNYSYRNYVLDNSHMFASSRYSSLLLCNTKLFPRIII